jgi:hypothetical protein
MSWVCVGALAWLVLLALLVWRRWVMVRDHPLPRFDTDFPSTAPNERASASEGHADGERDRGRQ